jgi:hypothetical protein
MLGSFIAVALVARRSIKVLNSYPNWWMIEMLSFFFPLTKIFCWWNSQGRLSPPSRCRHQLGWATVRIRRAIVSIMRYYISLWKVRAKNIPLNNNPFMFTRWVQRRTFRERKNNPRLIYFYAFTYPSECSTLLLRFYFLFREAFMVRNEQKSIGIANNL